MSAIETRTETIADAPAIRAAFANLDDIDPGLVRRLTDAQTTLRSAAGYAAGVATRNRATAARLTDLTTELADADPEQLSALRAERHALMSDHSFAADDVEAAARREITAVLGWADIAVELLTTRPRRRELVSARVALDAARQAISSVNAHLNEAGTGDAMRAGASAYQRLEDASAGLLDEQALAVIDGAISEVFWPVKPSVRPDAWRLSRVKSDRLVPELVAHRRAVAAAATAQTGG